MPGTMDGGLQRAAARFVGREALVAGDRRRSFAALRPDLDRRLPRD